jgi:hypothetical protein
MAGIAQNPSIVSKGVLCLRAVALSLLGALVFAVTAQAKGPGPAAYVTAASADAAIAQSTGALPISAEAPKSGAPVGTVTEKAPETPPVAIVTEKAPETPPVAIGTEKAPEPAPVGPGTEKSPEIPPVGTVTEKAPEIPPVGTGTEKSLPEPAPVVPVTETAQEAAHSSPVFERGPEGSPPAPAAPQVAASYGAGQAEPEVASAVNGSQAPTAGGPEAPATSAGRSSVGTPVGMTAGRWAGSLSCQLPSLGGRTGDNCIAGGVAGQSVLFALPAAGAPSGGGHGSSAVGSPPVDPAPGSAPSGVAGGSAMGGSGLSISGFLTLAGLLLLAAPRAMRRLRLLCEPWLTACFVLIPERPG